MKEAFTQCRDLFRANYHSTPLKQQKKQDNTTKNILEKWKDNSSLMSIGHEFDLQNTI